MVKLSAELALAKPQSVSVKMSVARPKFELDFQPSPFDGMEFVESLSAH
jgi:hypothetical protein